ncbi:hypothetical protein P12x_003013 [Tundrisphaera lichenicola]|uniref:hypothetical protein n=1 Tax=Tundrisphaera lichenicola TaxID=2029860 RepID=UPI003EC07C07
MMTQTSGLRSFARLVESMRARQATYFKDRDPRDLALYKASEREVDRRVAEILDERPRLFDEPDQSDHARRNHLAVFASATETVRVLDRQGVIVLPDATRELLDRCHRLIQAENGSPE